ncbi:MAG: hypothetical protein EXS08_02065 [Planctomycetes bacterium]|nr:hypothetical protein [Planctomycetota bacterium]
MTPPNCPECRVAMEAGHVADRARSSLCTPLWVAGPADWTGTHIWSVASKLKGHDVYAVVSYRCPNCGFLSSFARTPTTPDG